MSRLWQRVKRRAGRPATHHVPPIWVRDLDLLAPPTRIIAPPSPPGLGPYRSAYVLLRVGSEPLTFATYELSDGELDVDAVVAEAEQIHGDRIAALAERTLSTAMVAGHDHDCPPISVVIGTRDRPEKLGLSIAQLLKQDYPAPFEVIVVENGRGPGSSDASERLVAERFGDDDRVRYRSIPRPGLSRARNAGLAEARYPITAFLSDDILVDSTWMAAVARGFARHDRVTCVVGYCPQLYLDTETQQCFEHQLRWSSVNGFEPFLASRAAASDPLYPYRIATSNGSNMSFDTEYFRSAGGFDEALGPGTRARGGEDLDAPIRALLAGGDVAFEPAALGWHADDQAGKHFRSTMYTYGLGLTAFLTSHLLDPRTRGPLMARIPRGARYLLPASVAEIDDPLDDVAIKPIHRAANIVGRIMGPIEVIRSRRDARAA